MNLGPHASFIVASYAAAGLVLFMTLLWIALDYRTQRRALAALEAKGAKRRSAKR